MNPSEEQQGVWSQHAAQWQRVGAPLRPTEDDGRLMLAMAAPALQAGAGPASIVVLGVTPEVVQLPWPEPASLEAFDHSAEMIASVWRPHPSLPSSVRQVSWQAMPLAGHSVDVAAGDASLNALPALSDYDDVLAEVARVLKPTGALVLRCFIRPDVAETLDAVAAAALSGRIASFHALKWRVAMARPNGAEFSVAVADILADFERIFPDRDHLARCAGWPRTTIDTIDAYRGVSTRYTFPTLAALLARCAAHFELAETGVGRYELAERCPTIRLRPAGPRAGVAA